TRAPGDVLIALGELGDLTLAPGPRRGGVGAIGLHAGADRAAMFRLPRDGLGALRRLAGGGLAAPGRMDLGIFTAALNLCRRVLQATLRLPDRLEATIRPGWGLGAGWFDAVRRKRSGIGGRKAVAHIRAVADEPRNQAGPPAVD